MIDLNDDVNWPPNGPNRFHNRRMVPLPKVPKRKKTNYLVNEYIKSSKDDILNKYFEEYSKQKIPKNSISDLPTKTSRLRKVMKIGKSIGRAGLIAGLGAAAYGYFKQKREARGGN